MVELGLHHGDGPLGLREIAESQGLSADYLEQLFLPLRRAGLVRSLRGAHGGYVLARAPEEISARQILDALEGPLTLVECAADASGCERAAGCAALDLYRELDQTIAG